MSLPATPPSNAFVRSPQKQPYYPLELVLCARCGHLQLGTLVEPTELFTHDYVYTSGTSPVTVAHFSDYVDNLLAHIPITTSAFIVEIGSNDGTFLRQFKKRGFVNLLGVDPASDIAAAATAEGIMTLPVFFNESIAGEIVRAYSHADLVIANNVFAHMPELQGAARAVQRLLAPAGVFVFEVSYLGDVVGRLLFDTIYHEHYSYHAVAPLCRMFDALGMQVCRTERTVAQGGSIRIFVQHKAAAVEHSSVRDYIAYERGLGLSKPATYQTFHTAIRKHGEKLRARLGNLRAQGKSIAGYGAPAKLTTLMHAFELDRSHVDYIVDDSTWKQGLYTPGLNIPILAPSVLYEKRPDACVVFAWNFADDIIRKHRLATDNFIVPLRETT